MRPLEGRVALVTGVGRRAGIGYAIARRLLESGASVLAHAWTRYDVESWGEEPGEADAVLARLRELGPAEQHQADFADPDAPTRVVAAARQTFGRVDILVVNHTRSGHKRLSELTAEHL